jgi:hypothetical protein
VTNAQSGDFDIAMMGKHNTAGGKKVTSFQILQDGNRFAAGIRTDVRLKDAEVAVLEKCQGNESRQPDSNELRNCGDQPRLEEP